MPSTTDRPQTSTDFVAQTAPAPVRTGLRRWFAFATPGVRITIESLLLLIACACVFVWFYAPYFVRDYINNAFKNLPEYTGRVEWVRIHPITASIDVYSFHIDKKSSDVPVHFFFSPRWNVSLQWREILRGEARACVTIYSPKVNIVNGPSTGSSQVGISGVWIDAIRALIPWRVNQLYIHGGDAHFLDFHADPKVDLELANLEFAADNMSNADKLKVPLPATVKITANPLLTGFFEMDLAVNFDEKFATFSQSFRMEHVPAVGANSALQNYLKVRCKSGEIGLYSELAGDKGVYHGYVKPFFKDLQFEPNPADEGNVGAVWSGVLNTVKGLFENDDKVIATQAPISGRVDNPSINTWAAIGGVLWNAYIESLKPGFDRSKTPAKPTDTVTTPQSTETQKEVQKLQQQGSPAEKPSLDQVKQKAAQEEEKKGN
jgi:hypothetical protein